MSSVQTIYHSVETERKYIADPCFLSAIGGNLPESVLFRLVDRRFGAGACRLSPVEGNCKIVQNSKEIIRFFFQNIDFSIGWWMALRPFTDQNDYPCIFEQYFKEKFHLYPNFQIQFRRLKLKYQVKTAPLLFKQLFKLRVTLNVEMMYFPCFSISKNSKRPAFQTTHTHTHTYVRTSQSCPTSTHTRDVTE